MQVFGLVCGDATCRVYNLDKLKISHTFVCLSVCMQIVPLNAELNIMNKMPLLHFWFRLLPSKRSLFKCVPNGLPEFYIYWEKNGIVVCSLCFFFYSKYKLTNRTITHVQMMYSCVCGLSFAYIIYHCLTSSPIICSLL